MITPEKTIVNRRDAEVDNGFREVSISTVTLAKRNFMYLFYYTECLNFKENLTAFFYLFASFETHH